MPKTRETRAYLILGTVSVLLGANWPVMKIGLMYITPLWFASVRISIAAVCLFALVAVRGRLRFPRRDEMALLFVVGVFQIGINTALVHFGVGLIEAGRSVMLAYTTPLWVTPLAAVFLRERLTARRLGGVALGVSGIAVLFGPGTFDPADGRALAGSAMMILAAIVIAGVIVHIRGRGGILQSIELLPWQMTLGALLLVALAAVAEGAPSPAWSPEFLVVLAYNGVVATAFCIWGYIAAMRDLPATSTAVGSLGAPVAGVLVATVFLGEPLTTGKMIGLALIMGGVLTVSLADLYRRSA